MIRNVKYLILGNGIAGWTAARTLLENVSKEDILMVTREAGQTIRRPLLSKRGFSHFRFDQFDMEDPFVEVLAHTEVLQLLPEEKKVVTTSGTIGYEKCIYALGAESFVPPIPGAQLEGVCTVRTMEDYRRIRTLAYSARHAVIIGGGVIGMEMAELLCREGISVTVLEGLPRLLPRILDEVCSMEYQKRITNAWKGRLSIVCDAGPIRILGNDRATKVTYRETTIPCDLVILSCGVKANVKVFSEAGGEVQRGILADARMKTSLPDLYVCGDCAQVDGQMPALWGMAIRTGEIAAYQALGKDIRLEAAIEPVILHSDICALYASGKSVQEETEEYSVTYHTGSKEQEAMVMQKQKDTFYKVVKKDGRTVGRVLIGNLSGSVKGAVWETED